tara:strand:+ start:76 stop:594 length:519 start_codon:yes stop_codon:yes gene_type:complete
MVDSHYDQHKVKLPAVALLQNKQKETKYFVEDKNAEADPDALKAGAVRVYACNGQLKPPTGYDDRHKKRIGDINQTHSPANHQQPTNSKKMKLGDHTLHHSPPKLNSNSNPPKRKKTAKHFQTLKIITSISKDFNKRLDERRVRDAQKNTRGGACMSFLGTVAIGTIVLLLL